jgi:glycosyltransferase involved in cell wall biosynthesis
MNCDAIVAVSQAISDHIEILIPSVAPRLRIIPYGVEFDNSGKSSSMSLEGGVIKIFYCGRMVKDQKRCLDLIRVALELDRRGIPFEMTLIGDGPERVQMEELGQDLIFRRVLWMPGKMPNHMALQLMKDHHVFLLTSSFEGLPVSLLEAMSQGLVPVVSGIRSGIPELIQDGLNGFTAPMGNIKAFADRIEYLYQHPAEGVRVSEASRRTIADGGYLLQNMVDRYLQLFEEIIVKPPLR